MKPFTVDEARLARLMDSGIHLRLGAGAGANGHIDVCVNQAADWLSGGDGKSDYPACASPVIASFTLRLNDSSLFYEHRDLLKPYAVKLVGSKASKRVDEKRACIAADYAVRVFLPLALDSVGKKEEAETFRALKPIVNKATAAMAHANAYHANAHATLSSAYALSAAAYAAANRHAYATLAAADALSAAAYVAADAYVYALSAAAATLSAADALSALSAAAYAATLSDASAAATISADVATLSAAASAAASAAYPAAFRDKLRQSALKCLDDMLAVQ